jgi:hypothetical protein
MVGGGVSRKAIIAWHSLRDLNNPSWWIWKIEECHSRELFQIPTHFKCKVEVVWVGSRIGTSQERAQSRSTIHEASQAHCRGMGNFSKVRVTARENSPSPMSTSRIDHDGLDFLNLAFSGLIRADGSGLSPAAPKAVTHIISVQILETNSRASAQNSSYKIHRCRLESHRFHSVPTVHARGWKWRKTTKIVTRSDKFWVGTTNSPTLVTTSDWWIDDVGLKIAETNDGLLAANDRCNWSL